MHRQLLSCAAVVLLVTSPALAQQVISPYGEAPQPVQAIPPQSPPPATALPPVPPPPPVAPPPPPGYYQQPYYGQQYQQQYQAPPPMYFQPQPLRFHEVEEPRYGLVVAGAVVLGASWSINAMTAYLADEWKLAVPVLGPFLETQNVRTGPGYEYNRPLVGLLVFDGLVETAGAVMLFAGALTHHRVRVYDRPTRVSVVPVGGPATAGVAAFGRF